jgi:hypothetical protein
MPADEPALLTSAFAAPEAVAAPADDPGPFALALPAPETADVPADDPVTAEVIGTSIRTAIEFVPAVVHDAL